jgi:replicative DNA helicase
MTYSGRTDYKKLVGVVKDDRPLPYNVDAEMAVLGAMIIEPKPSIDNVLEILGSGSGFFDKGRKKGKQTAVFYNPRHQRIFSVLCELDDDDIDIDLISLVHALRQKNILDEIGGEIYLTELVDSVATTANLESWCKVVRDCVIRRKLIFLGGQMVDRGYDGERAASEMLDSAERDIMEISEMEERDKIYPIKGLIEPKNKDGAVAHLLKLRNNDLDVLGISTGYMDLNKKITGFKPGEMFVLAARPSIGKTSFALNLVSNIAINAAEPKSVGFFSLEMTAEQLARRLLCSECGYSEKDFIDGNVVNVAKVEKAAVRVGNAPIYIDPTSALRIRELKSKARMMKSKYDIQIIFIDYLQLMKAEIRSDNRQEEVSAISSGIKALAKELKIPVVVLAQLNRDVDKVAGMKPKLNHLRESGAIEQDADVVAFLHRDRNEQQEKSIEARKSGLPAELIIEKNRNGETGFVPLLFFPSITTFRSKSRMDESDIPGRG